MRRLSQGGGMAPWSEGHDLDEWTVAMSWEHFNGSRRINHMLVSCFYSLHLGNLVNPFMFPRGWILIVFFGDINTFFGGFFP